MKIVVQNFKTGELSVSHAPDPKVPRAGVLVRTLASVISVGTDRAIIGLAKKGPIGKALDRPDLARKVLSKAKTDGPWATYKVVKNLIAEPIPLGYSLVGEVVAVGSEVKHIAIGERVACAGLGYANHAEVVAVPQNLVAKVPDPVSDEAAAYVTIGAIAMHGLRQADQQFGSIVVVIGLGLVGLITIQLCRAAGYQVIGVDLDQRKFEFALRCGAAAAFEPNNPRLLDHVMALTRGIGADAVMIVAGSRKSAAPFALAPRLCRDRAKVVVVGDVRMDISRREYFEKELEVLQSRSYGPGRYDPNYEEKGNDYPPGYVRWTEQRNLQSFLDLTGSGALNPELLTTHRYPFDEAEVAYQAVTNPGDALTIGVVLRYGDLNADRPSASRVQSPLATPAPSGKVVLGVIGAGRFAKGILLPALLETNGFEIRAVGSARGLSAQAVADRYSAAIATSDIVEVLDASGVGAVVVATRHGSHGRYVVDALERGKHVFVEKPLCVRLEELDEIERAAAASSGTLMVGFNRRFSPLFVNLIEHFADRAEPIAMSYRVNAGRIPLNHELAWVHDPEDGGGRIIGEVCHFVDLMQATCGALPVSVNVAAINYDRRDLVNDDVITLTIQFADGSQGSIHYWANGDASYPKERFEVFCAERIAVLDNFRTLELVAENKTKKKKLLNQQKGFPEEANAFLQACRTRKPAIPLDSLIETTRVTIEATRALTGTDGSHSRPAMEENSR